MGLIIEDLLLGRIHFLPRQLRKPDVPPEPEPPIVKLSVELVQMTVYVAADFRRALKHESAERKVSMGGIIEEACKSIPKALK